MRKSTSRGWFIISVFLFCRLKNIPQTGCPLHLSWIYSRDRFEVTVRICNKQNMNTRWICCSEHMDLSHSSQEICIQFVLRCVLGGWYRFYPGGSNHVWISHFTGERLMYANRPTSLGCFLMPWCQIGTRPPVSTKLPRLWLQSIMRTYHVTCTLYFRYIAVIYNSVTHKEQQLQWYKFDQTIHSRTTPHTSPSRCLSWNLQRNMTAIYRERTAHRITTVKQLCLKEVLSQR